MEDESTVSECHADRDGDCNWKDCPQRVHYQDVCPLDVDDEDEPRLDMDQESDYINW